MTCIRVLNGSVLLSPPGCEACEILEGCRGAWDGFGVIAAGAGGGRFWLSDVAGMEGNHELFDVRGGERGTTAGPRPAGERLGRVVVVMEIEGRKGFIEMHGLTKCRVSSEGGAVKKQVGRCVADCLGELSKSTGGEAVRGEEER